MQLTRKTDLVTISLGALMTAGLLLSTGCDKQTAEPVSPGIQTSTADSSAAVAAPEAALGNGVYDFAGRLTDENNKPVSQAMVVFAGARFNGADTVSVFSDEAGNYRLPGVNLEGAFEDIAVTVKVVGYDTTDRAISLPTAAGGIYSNNISLRSTSNVASQVPPSAWLKDVPDSQGWRTMQLLCGNACHAFPNPSVMGWSATLAGKSLEERQELWMTEAMSMKLRFGLIYPDKILPPIMETDEASSAYDLFGPESLAMFTDLLAQHMPTSFDHFELDDYTPNAELAVNANTQIYEYDVEPGTILRELDLLPGSPYIWVVDYRQGKLLRLDSRTGEQHWVDVPGDDPGPHTISPMDNGDFLVALMDYPAIAQFNPRTEEFKLFDKVPAHSDVHDIALDHRRFAAIDRNNGTWLTLAAQNKLGRLDLTSGEVEVYEAPVSNDRQPFTIAIYSAVMTSDKNTIWYTQLFGGIGAFNIETREFEKYFEFPYGDGPHRMAISDEDVIYVPLSGAGEIVAIDGKTQEIIKHYALPDRNTAPYNVSWDDERKKLWVGTSSGDFWYLFDPATEEFTVFPLPSEKTFFRMITVNHDNGDIWASYGNILPKGTAPTKIVRLVPGDAGKQ